MKDGDESFHRALTVPLPKSCIKVLLAVTSGNKTAKKPTCVRPVDGAAGTRPRPLLPDEEVLKWCSALTLHSKSTLARVSSLQGCVPPPPPPPSGAGIET